jgi:predicted transcriptional regulator
LQRKSNHVTDAELGVLQVLWDRGSATVREIADVLYPEGGVSEYATVKKLAARLEAKGCIQRDDSQKAHVLRATIGREILIGRRLQEVVDTLCEGTWSPLLTQLVHAKGLTVRQQRMLSALIDDMEQKSNTKKQNENRK